MNLLTKEFIIFQVNLCKLGFAARLFYKENKEVLHNILIIIILC